jgi:hypothetical protein
LRTTSQLYRISDQKEATEQQETGGLIAHLHRLGKLISVLSSNIASMRKRTDTGLELRARKALKNIIEVNALIGFYYCVHGKITIA